VKFIKTVSTDTTDQQDMTVKAKYGVGSIAENPSKDPDTISLQPPEGAKPVGM